MSVQFITVVVIQPNACTVLRGAKNDGATFSKWSRDVSDLSREIPRYFGEGIVINWASVEMYAELSRGKFVIEVEA